VIVSMFDEVELRKTKMIVSCCVVFFGIISLRQIAR
jgi:hypothetical protein